MRLKKVGATIMAMALIVTSASAAEISPRYQHIAVIICSIKFNGELATCFADVTTYAGTTNITVTMSLQQQNADGSYKTLKTWPSESVSDRTITVSKNYFVQRGYAYRTYISIQVTRNGTNERVTSISNTIKPD